MAKNEVGEFELVLGNKQLLSVFFIVVILLGVFFTMGYIVGRNSGGGTLEAGNRKGPDGKPTIIDSPGAPPPTQVPTASEQPTPAAEPKREPKKEEPSPAPVVETPKPVEAKKADKKKDDKKKSEAAAEPAPAPASTGALAGTYLQLAAVPKAEADLLISVLRKKGFSAAAGPGPKDSNLFRVLVGPLSGADAISSTRTSLNDAGMPGSKAIVKRF
jgi:cell division protein FtsN